MLTLRTSIAKNSIMLYIRMLITTGISVFTSRAVLEILGVIDFGIYNVVGGIVIVLGFVNGSLAGASTRFLTYAIGAGDKDKERHTFWKQRKDLRNMAEMKKQTEFKLYKRDSVFFDQNTAPVNIAYAHEVNDVAILPLGAIEQHGPHCPNGLDSFNAICLAKKVAEKSGATVLPCPMYGGHPYMHMGMPATIALNYETNMALIHDIIAGASNVGYNKFILLVAHGQDSSFIPAVHKLGMEGYFTVASTWYDFLGDNKAVLSDYMWHADEAETSMALSLYGDLVHMDLAIDGGGTTLVDGKWKKAPGETSHPFQFYHFDGTFALMEKDDLDYGVIGNPTKASKEKGDALVEKVVEGYSAFIKDLLERHPVGINPLGFRNPLGFNGFNGGAYPTFDKDHDEKGRPIYYNK